MANEGDIAEISKISEILTKWVSPVAIDIYNKLRAALIFFTD